MNIQSQLVLKDSCAWPNLIRISADKIGAVIFNRPSHGLEEGSLELWSCAINGLKWQYLSTPCPCLSGQNRMHSACGVTDNGNIHVLSTGFSVAEGKFISLEPLWHSSSADGGKSWEISRGLEVEGIDGPCIPHGAIICENEAKLWATVYRSYGKGEPSYTWLIKSNDAGRSWIKHSRIGHGDTNEAFAIMRNSEKIAAVRTHIDHHTRLFTCASSHSEWEDRGPLTLPMQHPGHLLSLGEKNLLLTYGIRNKGLMAIGGRFSPDFGESWHAPFVLHQFPVSTTDCGYPSTIALEKDQLLTGYYTNVSESYEGYQFGVLVWKLSDILSPQELLSISDGKRMTR